VWPSDPPGAGPLLQGGVRPRHRAAALPVQRAAPGGEQRPLRGVQAEAAELPAALEEDHPEAHPGPPEKKRCACFENRRRGLVSRFLFSKYYHLYFSVPKKSESADTEEPKLENEGNNGEELNVHVIPAPADRKPPTSRTSKVLLTGLDHRSASLGILSNGSVHINLFSLFLVQQDKWHPLLHPVNKVQRNRWLKHSVLGPFSQSSLMATIVEFALKEEPLDVEKMRKCLLKQVKTTLSSSPPGGDHTLKM